MIGKVNIHGHIGPSYVDAQGLMHKGTVLLDVIEQCESFPEAEILEVSVNSPGGYADIGDSIYDYLVSLKAKGKQIVTIQTGLVGSIATKIFLAGDKRIVDDRYQFWIHNPYLDQVSGDQDDLRAMADGLAKTEQDLRNFYAQFTSITPEGLDALMKLETGLSADQCIKFKFATEKKLIPAFNSIKMSTKKEDKSTLKQELMALVDKVLGNEKKGVAPKAQVPGNETKNLVVMLADNAGSFWVEGEQLAEGAPAFMLDESGQPTAEAVPDGDYKLEDGSMVTVAGGLISAVMPAEGSTEEMISKVQAQQMVKDAVEAALKEKEKSFTEALNKVKEESKKEVESQILALKKDVKLGVQPTKAVLGMNGGKTYKSIPEKLNEIREEKRKQQFKN